MGTGGVGAPADAPVFRLLVAGVDGSRNNKALEERSLSNNEIAEALKSDMARLFDRIVATSDQKRGLRSSSCSSVGPSRLGQTRFTEIRAALNDEYDGKSNPEGLCQDFRDQLFNNINIIVENR